MAHCCCTRWRIQIQQYEFLHSLVERPAPDDVILVDTVDDLAIPTSTATNLAWTTVSLDHQEVARFQPILLKLTWKQLEAAYVAKVQALPAGVRLGCF